MPTLGRWRSLERCLATVVPQLRSDDELLVVLNGPQSPPAGLLPGRCQVVQEPRRGASWARNAGWKRARHASVVFLDDDTFVDSAWLDTVRTRLDDVDIVTGGVAGANTSAPIARLFDESYALHRGWVPRRYGGKRGNILARRDTWRAGVGASMAWQRSALERIDGFDPALGNGTPGGGAEDLDAFHRAMSAGCEIAYEPRAMVWHWHPATRRELKRTIHCYQRALGGWGAKFVLEEFGFRGVFEVAVQVGDSYRAAARALRSGTEVLVLPQLAAGPDAIRGAVAFAARRGASRTGGTVPHSAVREDQCRREATRDLEVDVATGALYQQLGEPGRVLLRNGRHPVGLLDVPPGSTVSQAIGSWASWVLRQPQGAW